MNIKGIRQWFPQMIFWLAMLILVTVVLGGAILLAAYNVPQQISEANSMASWIGRVILIAVSVLATAPLIEWWYNRLYHLFNMPSPLDGVSHEAEN